MQWPCTDLDHPGTPYLHAPRPALASGRGRFFPVEFQPPIEEPDSEYPFVLTTGRTLYHYNSANMTMREPGVTDKQQAPFFEIHAEDAGALGIADREVARLVSRRGALEAEAHYSERVYPGLVWMSLHFAEQKVNWLTHDVGDPLIGTPEYKVSAVRVETLAIAVTEKLGEPRLDVESCESTQLLVDTSLPEGAIVVADHQTAGRGRLGRSWEAPAGNGAALSRVLLKPPPERHAPELSLVAGIAVADALERILGLSVQIKWPNDVMLRRAEDRGLPRRGARRRGRARHRRERRADEGRAARRTPGRIRTLTGRGLGPRGCSCRPLLDDLGQPLRRVARRADWTRCTTVSARATSCAAAGSP